MVTATETGNVNISIGGETCGRWKFKKYSNMGGFLVLKVAVIYKAGSGGGPYPTMGPIDPGCDQSDF